MYSPIDACYRLTKSSAYIQDHGMALPEAEKSRVAFLGPPASYSHQVGKPPFKNHKFDL